MKLLVLLICLFLFGLINGQQELQKRKSLDGSEKKVAPKIKSDTSFLELKKLFLFIRDYSGTTPTPGEMENYVNCLKAQIIKDSINQVTQIDSKDKYIAYMFSYAEAIPDIVKNCNLNINITRDYIKPTYLMQARFLDLINRYPKLAADPKPWSTLIAEMELPEMTLEDWMDRKTTKN